MNPVTSVTVIPLATATSLAANSDTLPTVVTLIQMSTLTLLFVVEALRALRADEGFVNLLRAEGLYTMPAKLAERVGPAPGEA